MNITLKENDTWYIIASIESLFDENLRHKDGWLK
jgi:hypothetical protein